MLLEYAVGTTLRQPPQYLLMRAMALVRVLLLLLATLAHADPPRSRLASRTAPNLKAASRTAPSLKARPALLAPLRRSRLRHALPSAAQTAQRPKGSHHSAAVHTSRKRHSRREVGTAAQPLVPLRSSQLRPRRPCQRRWCSSPFRSRDAQLAAAAAAARATRSAPRVAPVAPLHLSSVQFGSVQ